MLEDGADRVLQDRPRGDAARYETVGNDPAERCGLGQDGLWEEKAAIERIVQEAKHSVWCGCHAWLDADYGTAGGRVEF